MEGNTVYVYAYALRTVKTKEDRTPFEGAEFALFRTEGDAKNQENAIATGVSDADGLVVYKTTDGDVIKLQSGTYYIVEAKASQGFALHGNPIPVSIEATYGDTFVNGTWSSIKTIARELSFSQSTVRRAIQDLQKAKLVRKEYAYRKNGSHTSNRYYVV